MALAHATAVFVGLAWNGKLGPLDRYLRPDRPRQQTPEEMLAAMRAIKARMH